MENNILHRKERLIITTIEIIDELGIQKLSTREIARRQGISEATLFRHFKSKNELLFTVLDFYSQFDEDIFQSTKFRDMDAKDKLLFFINSYAEYYENYPAITSIMQILDVLRYEPELAEKVINIQNNRMEFLIQLIEEAKNVKEINPDAESGQIADIILGICREVCLRWRITGRKFSLKSQIMSTLNLALKAFIGD
ncbi:TetR/AcrR family transcriptional regulator [Anaerocolumna sp. AGMB13025]|uniref:TetR/AcrR family transcriptional regulator n=1 Tax=Anaerocolumna sp. AGMB13025 TaxID=3039116 RepID=UPI00241D81AD|nr:TetR/AcrR family transcriptional regulator [Anaerocolumna sp. AGMB13025]WFR59656.1 TetR/AcrR family transcriptional regulator [Anaerocolumna sp. AGMB13025]